MHNPTSSSTLFICLVLTSVIVIAKAQQDTGEQAVVARQKEYRFITTIRLSWHKAMEYCRSQGMFLVSIKNQDEYEAVKNISNKSDFWKKNEYLTMWTSLNDIGEEDDFHWASTGMRNMFDIWRKGEPNNARQGLCTYEDCGALVHNPARGIAYALDDRACSNAYVFMCET